MVQGGGNSPAYSTICTEDPVLKMSAEKWICGTYGGVQ